MVEQPQSAPLGVSVFSDYICPFCYIGHLRLARLAAERTLAVDWRFLEIHPDNPPEGRPVAELGYPPQHWEMLMVNLARMAAEEGVALAERTFTTNSRQALKLAQAVRERQPEAFEALNARLYEAYFVHRENVGDPGVLQALADSLGIDPSVVERAWHDAHYDQVLADNQREAARLGINGTPSYVFGDRVYSGAIPLHMMRRAAQEAGGSGGRA